MFVIFNIMISGSWVSVADVLEDHVEILNQSKEIYLIDPHLLKSVR